MHSKRHVAIRTSLALLLSFSLPLSGRADDSSGVASRKYWVDATLFSLIPDEGLDTYRGHGSGGAEPNDTLRLGVAENGRRFDVDIEPLLKSRRFMITVVVEPQADDRPTEARRIEYDLTELRPQTIDIAHDDDGRVYRLNLTPRVIEHTRPKQFQVRDLHLDSWSFPSSPVVLNDQYYLGQMGASYGQLAWCDVPGLAKIEFSLLRLKGAKPWGSLQNGTVVITHPDGTTLRISNVNNGIQRNILDGGPYTVWVRWLKPTQSIEEYRRQLKERIEDLKQRTANGDLSIRSEILQHLEKMSESDRPTLISFGVGPVHSEDRTNAD